MRLARLAFTKQKWLFHLEKGKLRDGDMTTAFTFLKACHMHMGFNFCVLGSTALLSRSCKTVSFTSKKKKKGRKKERIESISGLGRTEYISPKLVFQANLGFLRPRDKVKNV